LVSIIFNRFFFVGEIFFFSLFFFGFRLLCLFFTFDELFFESSRCLRQMVCDRGVHVGGWDGEGFSSVLLFACRSVLFFGERARTTFNFGCHPLEGAGECERGKRSGLAASLKKEKRKKQMSETSERRSPPVSTPETSR